MDLVLQTGAEAEEAEDAEEEGQDVEAETEFRFVDAVVPAGQLLDGIVIQGPGHEAEDGGDEGRDADEPDGRDAEVVGGPAEQLRHDTAQHDEPRGRHAVGDEAVEDLGEQEHAEGAEDDVQQVLVGLDAADG